MSVWSDFYLDRVGAGYSNYARERYKPFLDELRDLKATKYREEGCGIGTISRILLTEGYRDIELFDLCPEQVELARQNTFGALPVSQGDILAYHSPTDVIFSHGVIEHFDDDKIRLILNRQCETSKKVVHYVPTNGYSEPSFGDERLLPVEFWLDTFKPSGHRMFNGGCDLVLVWD